MAMNAQQLEERSHKAGAAIPDLRMSHLWRVHVVLGFAPKANGHGSILSAQRPNDFAHPATRGFLFLTLGCRLAFRLRRCLSPRLSPAHTPSPLPLLPSLIVVSPCFIFTLFGRRRKILPISPSLSLRWIPFCPLNCFLHLSIPGVAIGVHWCRER